MEAYRDCIGVVIIITFACIESHGHQRVVPEMEDNDPVFKCPTPKGAQDGVTPKVRCLRAWLLLIGEKARSSSVTDPNKDRGFANHDQNQQKGRHDNKIPHAISGTPGMPSPVK